MIYIEDPKAVRKRCILMKRKRAYGPAGEQEGSSERGRQAGGKATTG
jgi:hypothetical protein